MELINLPRILDERGNLTFVEGGNHIPFDIKRVYWIYDVPAGENRGEHAHKELFQLIVPLSGSFSIMLDDGKSRTDILMNHPFQGIIIPPKIWHHLHDFSSGAVALSLTSDIYKESDYLRNYNDFLQFIND